MKRLFFGGIHPKYNKEMSLGKLELCEITPEKVIIPLQQHIGVVCKPLVKAGDYVLKGQKIGDNDGLCVPVHSSVSGTVEAIKPHLHPNGQIVDSIIIANDFKDTSVEYKAYDLPLNQLDTDTVLHTIREAGIVGMGGAAFPGNIKALTALGNIDTVIANACECEPYITSDDMLLRTNAKQVLDGMQIVNKLLNPKRLVLAIEDNKKSAIERLNCLKAEYHDLEIKVLPTKYPQGSEKQLIQAVTGRQVPPKKLPIDVDCVVFNVSTFAAIYKAVRLGLPLTERLVTVTGEGVLNPQNFIVRIGTPFEVLIKQAGGLSEDCNCVLSGGPMMGVAQANLSVPIVKATNSVLCLKATKTTEDDALACIRCGKCLTVCPMKLQPIYISRFADDKNTKELKRLNVNDCMECGSCAYTCPAKLPLVDKCRLGKKLLEEEVI